MVIFKTWYYIIGRFKLAIRDKTIKSSNV